MLSPTSPILSFNSSGIHGFATSTPIERDENGRRRLNAYAIPFVPRYLANTETGSHSIQSEAGRTDCFGLSAPKFGIPGSSIPKRIFVGGIPLHTTGNDLHDLFAQFGRVRRAKIILDEFGVSKGYGFITFDTEAEAKALCDRVASKTLGPIMIEERCLTVAPAVKKQIATPMVENAMHPAAQQNMGLVDANGYMYYYLPQGPAPGVPFGLPQQQFSMMQQPYVTGGYYHEGAGDPAAFQHAPGYLQAQGFPMQLCQAPAQIPQGYGQVYQIPGPYIQPYTLLPQQYVQPAQPGQYDSNLFDGFPPQVTGQDWYPM